MLSAEVFEAMIASAGAEASIAESRAILRSTFSGAASMITSTLATASATLVVAFSRSKVVLQSSWDSLPRSTPFFRIDITWPTAMLSCVCEMSYRRVS